jgi:molecular chaperone GrpE
MDQSMDEFIGGLSEETKSKLPSDLLEDFKSLPDISETDALTIQNQKLKDDLLRMAAELQNQKNFFERQKEDVRLYASEEFAKNIIVGIDSLEMGLKYTDVESSPVWDILNTQYTNLRQGVDLTIKKFDEVFEKNNLKRIPTHNVVFDPTLHQAISVIASDSHDNDVIVDTLQTGYTYNGRVIRPAMVSVCKK